MNHLFKRTVVLLNSFDYMDDLLKRAEGFARAHKTTLEILYVHEAPLFDLPDFFSSSEGHSAEAINKTQIRHQIQSHLDACGIQGDHAILVYEDDTLDQVIHYGKGDKDILFVTAYHETLSADLIEKTPHSFWIIKDPQKQDYKKVVIPIDFTQESKKVLNATKHIFAQSEIHMVHDYRYLLDTISVPIDYLDISPVVTPDLIAINEVLKQERAEMFEAYREEFGVDGVCLEAEGALDEDLIAYIGAHSFDLIVMYHQDTDLFLSPTLILYLLNDLDLDFFVFNL